MTSKRFLIIPLLITVAFSSCSSIKKKAVNMIADSLSSGGSSTVFTGENDPALVGDAFPFALKMYEILLEQAPENANLYLTTGSAFIMYANAYIQTPADMLQGSEYKRQKAMYARAKNLYLRGRKYVMQGIELNHPGFIEASTDREKLESFIAAMTVDDVPFLYWAGTGWLAAYSINPFDFDLSLMVKNALLLLERSLELDNDYGEGAIHEVLISYYGSLPDAMGGSVPKARHHYDMALKYSGGHKASPYVSLATSVAVKEQNIAEYKALLRKALAIDVNIKPEYRLANIISQRKAEWLLEHIDDHFLTE